MSALLPILVSALGLLIVAGLAVISMLPPWWRRALLPATPTVGAMGLVLALHATTLAIPTRAGVWVVAGAAIAILIWRTRVDRRWWRFDRSTLVLAAVALACGAVPAAVALAPARTHAPGVLQVTLNNDAFAYVSVAAWLHDHPATDRPVIGKDVPAYGYAASHLRLGLRIGEELVLAAVSEVNRNDPQQDWYAFACLLLLLVPGSMAAAFRALGLNGGVGLAGGTVAALSALLSHQVFNSNTDALMGTMVAPLAVALIATRFGPRDNPHPPAWLAAGSLAALAGIYTEYLPVVAFGLLVFIVARSPRRWLATAVDGIRVAALSAVMAPLIWYDAIRSAGVLSAAGVGTPSPLAHVPAAVFAARTLGLASLQGQSASQGGALAFAAAIAALVAVAVAGSAGRRWLFAGLALNIGGIVTLLGRDRGYNEVRAVEVATPLLIMLAAAGADVLVNLARTAGGRRWIRVGAASAAGCALVAGIGLAGLNVRTTRQEVRTSVFADRFVTGDYADVTSWVVRHAGPSGRGTAVMAGDFFQQLWLVYATRGIPQVSYPLLFTDYGTVASFTGHPGDQTFRWVVVGSHEIVDADPGMIVESNADFRLLDLSRGRALVVAARPPVYTDGGGGANWIAPGGGFVVVHTPDVHSLAMTAETSIPHGGSTDLTIGGSPVHAGPAPAEVREPLVPGPWAELPLRPARAPGSFWVHFGVIRRG